MLELARLHRAAFEHMGVAAVPKVTGQRGLQIWVPINAGPSFRETTAWVEAVSPAVGPDDACARLFGVERDGAQWQGSAGWSRLPASHVEALPLAQSSSGLRL